jgi:hypothetical protein
MLSWRGVTQRSLFTRDVPNEQGKNLPRCDRNLKQYSLAARTISAVRFLRGVRLKRNEELRAATPALRLPPLEGTETVWVAPDRAHGPALG